MRKLKSMLRIFAVGVVVSPMVFAHQVSAANWQVLYSSRWWNGTRLVSQVVTQDGKDQPYVLDEWKNLTDPYDVRVTTPAGNTGGNTREFFWPESTPEVQDAQTCAIWSMESEGYVQQGSAVRIKQTMDGEGKVVSTKGITVTKNIWYAASWYFNVHVWDTSAPSGVFTLVGQFDMGEAVGKLWWDQNNQLQSNLKPLPWHFCTRVVGDQLTFKVWPDNPSNPWFVPAWDDPKYARTMTLPADWVYPGKTGWYIGHVRPGQSAEFKNIHTHAYR